MSNACPGKPSRGSVQGPVRSSVEMCAVHLTEVYSPVLFNEHSVQLGMSTWAASEVEDGWNLETKSRRRKCSNELQSARPKVLIANPPCPLFLTLQNHDDEKSSQHDHTSYLLYVNALNRCIVTISSLNIHRTRHHGMNCVLRCSLPSQVFKELKDLCVVGN